MQKKPIDMCSGPLLSNIFRYTVPILLTGLLQLLFNAADLMVVGQFCGSQSVGAVGATSSLINLIVNAFIGLSVGVAVTVAQALGSGQQEETHRTVHTAIPLAALSGLALTAIGVPLAPLLLEWMATPKEYLHLSSVYVQIYFSGMLFHMVFNFGASILRAAGDSKGPLWFLSAAGVVNVVLNVIFVTLFRMDVAGVALATTLSQGLAAVLVMRALLRRTDDCRLEWDRMRIYRTPLLRMMRIGIPAGIQSSLFSISNVLIQSTINTFGPVVGSGHAAGGSIEGFAYVVMNAFQQTSMNFTGQNVGALQYRRVRRVMSTCLVSVGVVGVVAGVTVWLLARPLLGLYITDSEAAIGYGVIRLTFICLPYFLCGLMEVASGVIRGLGVSLLPTVVTIFCVCVFRVVWIWWVFPHYATLEMLYISYPISWTMNFLAQMGIYTVLIRRRLRQIKPIKV